MRGAVLTAVHEDMMAREARRRNITISGVPSRHGVGDTALVDDLLVLGRSFHARDVWDEPSTVLNGRLQ